MKVVIIDTGCANLASVQWALQRLGCQPVVSLQPEQINNADKLLLPGVGTAAAAMQQLEQRQLIDLICQCQQPVLGICLGMQLLARHSMESGGMDTLGLIDASVQPLIGIQPLPHMGWNRVTPLADEPLFHGIAPGSHFYFVHSYAIATGSYTIAETDYGQSFSAAVRYNNFLGVQFHPERSGQSGARLLQNFLDMEA